MPLPAAAPTPIPGFSVCHLYAPGANLPAGFGALWDVLSGANEMLIKTACSSSSATLDLGKGSSNQCIYNTGYLYKLGSTNWPPVSYSGAEPLIAGAWYPKTANTTISMTQTEFQNPSYVLGYVCTWNGTQWKCGCQDASCTQSYWQLQEFKR